jgi:hypothetical protein
MKHVNMNVGSEVRNTGSVLIGRGFVFFEKWALLVFTLRRAENVEIGCLALSQICVEKNMSM